MTSSDWIISKITGSVPFKPSAIIIRNMDGGGGGGGDGDDYDDGQAPKSIALWMGKDDGRWKKLCDDITGIHHGAKPQRFDLSLKVPDEEVLAERADLVLLEIKENHGGKNYNVFFSFQLFGHVTEAKAAVQQPTLSEHEGYLERGSDIEGADGLRMTINDAKEHVLGLPNCTGFCFQRETDPNKVIKIWFKHTITEVKSDKGWITYLVQT